VFVGLRLLAIEPWDNPFFDLHAYWSTRSGISYEHATPYTIGAYLYAPAFAEAIGPLTWLPFPLFAGLWTAFLFGSLAWLSGRWALFALALPSVALTVALGQVDLLIALAIVIGFRYPGAWAFPILTKVTPGIGLLWFAVRREWRALGMALGVTLVIVAVSVALGARVWSSWIDLLARSAVMSPLRGAALIPVPLWLRLPAAAAVVAWGARTDRRWTVPLAAVVGMPVLWFNPLAALVAILPLVDAGSGTPAARWLRTRSLPAAEVATAPPTA
jgi:hypothetical protein